MVDIKTNKDAEKLRKVCEGIKCRYWFPQKDLSGALTRPYCAFYDKKIPDNFDCNKDNYSIPDLIYVLEKLINTVHQTPYIGFLDYIKKGKYD
jgi:hypothetical protein